MYYKTLLLLMVVFCATSVSLFSQTGNDLLKMPSTIPPFPEAKELGKYGDIPVSAYTGVPEISIPIYTVKVGSLSLPITLSYHASGIEVAQEATWVGLGWSLIAGGCLSYIPVGGLDNDERKLDPNEFQSVRNYLGNLGSEIYGNEDWYVDWDCAYPVKSTPQIIEKSIITSLLSGVNEQDVWSANFLNYSFKFVKHPVTDSIFVFGQRNKCEIINNGLNGYLVKGEDGTSYYFGRSEARNSYYSSWYLTKVVSAKGDEIVLKYKEAASNTLPSFSDMLSIQLEELAGTVGGLKSPARNYSQFNYSVNLYLSEIETKNELITFESSSNDRLDINNGYKLNRIVIKDKFTNTLKLSYRLAHSYFEGNSNIGGNFLNDGTIGVPFGTYTEDNRKKRLKLNSLVNENVANNSYIFSYNEQVPLPAKTSFAMDYWGYYNGQENYNYDIIYGAGHTLIPNIIPLIIATKANVNFIPDEFFTLKGAVRGASNSYVTAGMLKSIQYPTKGRTEFEFEPHDFNNYQVLSAEEEKSPNFVFSGGGGVTAYSNLPYRRPPYSRWVSTFTVKHKTVGNFNGFIENQYATISIIGVNVPNGFTTKEFRYTATGGTSSHLQEWSNEKIQLEPGDYKMICTLDTSSNGQSYLDKPDLYGSLIFNDYNEINTTSSIGGGVRVKSIINYDENNKVVSSKKYTYIGDDGKTSGKLMMPLNYYNFRYITVGKISYYEDGWGNTYKVVNKYVKPTYILSGNNSISLSAHSCGNKVGYNRVEVESYNGANNNGKEITYFRNSTAFSYFAGKIITFPKGNNGNMLRKVILKNNGDTVLTERYNYDILPETLRADDINILADDNYQGPKNVGTTNNMCEIAYIGRFNIYAYPTYRYYEALLGKETTHYFPSGKVKESSNYTYNLKNLSISTESTLTSKGETRYKKYKYPVDYSVSPYPVMVTNNILNTPIQVTDSLSATSTSRIFTQYDAWNPAKPFYAPKIVSSAKGSGALEERVIFDRYDKDGNLLEAHYANNTKECYYYGYNNSMPVIKAVNADTTTLYPKVRQALKAAGYTQLDALLKEATVLPYAKWTTFANNLLGNGGDALITVYTYDPTFGMTSQTDPNGLTTYYEYDLFGRLKVIRDNDRKVLKTYEYHYKN